MAEENGVRMSQGTKAERIPALFHPKDHTEHRVLWFQFLKLEERVVLVLAHDLGENYLARPSAARYLASCIEAEQDGEEVRLHHLRALPYTYDETSAVSVAESFAEALTLGELKFYGEGSRLLLYVSRGK